MHKAVAGENRKNGPSPQIPAKGFLCMGLNPDHLAYRAVSPVSVRPISDPDASKA